VLNRVLVESLQKRQLRSMFNFSPVRPLLETNWYKESMILMYIIVHLLENGQFIV